MERCFDSLQRFVEGIASAYPGTTQAARDILFIKTEKSDFRRTFTDLSLKSVFFTVSNNACEFIFCDCKLYKYNALRSGVNRGYNKTVSYLTKEP